MTTESPHECWNIAAIGLLRMSTSVSQFSSKIQTWDLSHGDRCEIRLYDKTMAGVRWCLRWQITSLLQDINSLSTRRPTGLRCMHPFIMMILAILTIHRSIILSLRRRKSLLIHESFRAMLLDATMFYARGTAYTQITWLVGFLVLWFDNHHCHLICCQITVDNIYSQKLWAGQQGS